MATLLRSCALAFVLLLAGAGAMAAEPPVIVTDAWSRGAPAGARTAGVFMTIENVGTEADRLVAARSNAAGTVEIHETRMAGAVMQMRRTEAIDIAPGTKVALRPGGFHVMLIDLAGPFATGARFSLTLVFEKAGEVPVEVEIRAPAHMTHSAKP